MFWKWPLSSKQQAGADPRGLDAPTVEVAPSPPRLLEPTIINFAVPDTAVMPGAPAAPSPARAFDAATVVMAPDRGFDNRTMPSPAPTALDTPLPAGTILNNQYEVLKTIGRGGFSYVYLCQHVRNGRLNAIKEAYVAGFDRGSASWVLNGPDKAVIAAAREALLKEVSAVSRVSHPGVVRLENVFEANDTIYFVMDFVEGEPLSSLLGRRGGISDATFIQIAGSLLEAVDHLHENDVLHGDIKPANIIVRPDKSVVLIDFGSAERLSDIHYPRKMVTPGYSAPERYTDGGELGPWSDAYSCAATFAAALAGRSPPDAMEVSRDRAPLDQLLGEVSRRSGEARRWSEAVEAALAPAVKDRTESVRLLREAMGFRSARKAEAAETRVADGHAIFVSYSRHDTDKVEAYVKALQLRGAGVWIDRKSIEPGSAAWGGEIMRGMRTSQIVLVFSSVNSMASDNVTREIYLADKLGRKIVVALLDDAPFNDDVSIFLTPTQHIRVSDFDAKGFAQTLVRLLDRVAAMGPEGAAEQRVETG